MNHTQNRYIYIYIYLFYFGFLTEIGTTNRIDRLLCKPSCTGEILWFGRLTVLLLGSAWGFGRQNWKHIAGCTTTRVGTNASCTVRSAGFVADFPVNGAGTPTGPGRISDDKMFGFFLVGGDWNMNLIFPETVGNRKII